MNELDFDFIEEDDFSIPEETLDVDEVIPNFFPKTKKAPKHYVNNEHFCDALVKYKADVAECKALNLPKPQIPNYIGECFIKIAEGVAKKPNFFSYCVDSETEALTKRGWLKYNEITKDDIILSVDITTTDLKWSTISDIYINKNYSGMCYKIDGKIDALITPGHKWVTKRGIQTIENIIVKDHILINGNSISIKNDIYSDSFVRLVGWFTTEGSITRYHKKRDKNIGYTVCFCQSNNSIHYTDIVTMLSSFNHNDYRISPIKNSDKTQFYISGDLCKDLLYCIDDISTNKAIKYEFINNLSTEQLIILKNTMMAGDGCNTQFSQKCKENFDRFLYICTLLGDRISFKKTENNSIFGKTQLENYIWIATYQKHKNKYCVVEKLNFNGKLKSHGGIKRNNIPNYFYEGVVWCPSTEYGTFVCRRGGRIYVTGNSYKDEMISDAIENSLMGFENFDVTKSQNPFSYFTQIIFFCFLRRIAKEKKQQYIKYKATENFGVLDEYELQDLGGAELQQIESYDNIYDFIQKYELAMLKKPVKIEKDVVKKGLDNFMSE